MISYLFVFAYWIIRFSLLGSDARPWILKETIVTLSIYLFKLELMYESGVDVSIHLEGKLTLIWVSSILKAWLEDSTTA